MATKTIKTAGKPRVWSSEDGESVKLIFTNRAGNDLAIQLSTEDARSMMQAVSGALQGIEADKIGDIKSIPTYPLRTYEIGPGFPEDLVLVFLTKQFGVQGYSMDLAFAEQLAEDLHSGIRHLRDTQSSGSSH